MIQRPLTHGPIAVRAWHGSPDWDYGAELRPHKKNRDCSGYGFCMTTSVDRARKYAGRNGRVVLIEMEILNGIEKVPRIPAIKAWEFLDKHMGNKKAQQVYLDMMQLEMLSNNIPVDENTLINPIHVANLCLIHNALKGEHQIDMAHWLVQSGIDAEWSPQSGNEDWLILFNTSKIVREKAMKVNEKDSVFEDMPKIKEQIAAYRHTQNAEMMAP